MEKPLKFLCYTTSIISIVFAVLFVLVLFGAFTHYKSMQHDMNVEQARYDSIRAIENS